MNPVSRNRKSSGIYLIVFLVSLLLIPHAAFALQQDNDQPLHVTADTSHSDQNSRTQRFQGHVQIDQGSTHLTADTVILHLNKQQKLEEGIAIGQYATYDTLPTADKPIFHARAQTIKFYPNKNLIVLLGDAEASQANNRYAGPYIEYQTKKQTIMSPASPEGRTMIVIEPQSSGSHEHT